MKSIYIFSEKASSDFFNNLSKEDQCLQIVDFQNFNAEEALKKNFDVILLGEGDFELFVPHLKAITWKASHIAIADTLVLNQNRYIPYNLNADCVLQILKNKKMNLNTAHAAMIIGSYDFVFSVVVKVALAGYSDIVVSLFEKSRNLLLETKLREFVFNLNLTFVSLSEITQFQKTCGLLISNLTIGMDEESFESLTYFNFLLPGAVFVDFQSQNNNSLIEEARRAELNVVEESEILTLKYKTLIEFCKNSP